jgi:hypothetical protein
MPRLSSAIRSFPAAAAAAVRQLGADLATARKRRKQSTAEWAARLQVSIPTLRRMEAGDPAVSMGVYATALWLIQRHDALAHAADPQSDLGALEVEIRRAEGRQGARKK